MDTPPTSPAEQPTARIVDMGEDAMLGVCEDGRRVWLSGPVVPGDEVRFVSEGKGGRVTELLTPAPERIEPPCPWFNACPGCALQPLPYEKQLQLKGDRVVETLRRVAGLEEVPFKGIQASPLVEGSRNKLDLTIEADKLGYRGREGQVVEIEDCLLGDPILRRWIPHIRDWIRERYDHLLHRCLLRTDGERSGVWIFFRGEMNGDERAYWKDLREDYPEIKGVGVQRDWKSPWQPIAGDLRVPFSLADEAHVAQADAFFQVNDVLADTLVRTVMSRLSEGPVGNALDLFCGTGAFTLPAASLAKRIVGLDSRPGKGPFQKADLRKRLPKDILNQRWYTVLTDPPRSGMEKKLVEQLRDQIAPKRLLYISCNPATLARDLQRLMAEGTYEVRSVEAFDLFPHTPHVETVCELERAGSGLSS